MIGSFQQNNVELHSLICHPSTTSVMLALYYLASRLTYHRGVQPINLKKEMRSRVVKECNVALTFSWIPNWLYRGFTFKTTKSSIFYMVVSCLRTDITKEPLGFISVIIYLYLLLNIFLFLKVSRIFEIHYYFLQIYKKNFIQENIFGVIPNIYK